MKTKESAPKQKANITLKLDRALLREIRILAAEKDTSISALIAEQFSEILRDRKGQEAAKQRVLARMRKGYNLGFTPPRSRDELYER